MIMIDGMGTFRTTIMIESAEHRGETRTVENALVDTRSEYTWVPREVLTSSGSDPSSFSVSSRLTDASSSARWVSRLSMPREREHQTSWCLVSRATWYCLERDR